MKMIINAWGDLTMYWLKRKHTLQATAELWTAYGMLRSQHQRDQRQQLASCSHNLALLLEKQGDFSAAEVLLTRTLALRRAFREGGHVKVVVSLGSLAGLYATAGRLEDAEQYFNEALKAARDTFGPTSFEATAYALNLADVLLRMNRPQVCSASGFKTK